MTPGTPVQYTRVIRRGNGFDLTQIEAEVVSVDGDFVTVKLRNNHIKRIRRERLDIVGDGPNRLTKFVAELADKT